MRAQIIGSLLSLGVVAAACTPPPPPLGQRDVAGYLAQLSEWAAQEAEVARAVRRILETEFVDEAEVRRQVAESLPRVDAQLAVIRTYRPGSPTLQGIHASYVAAWTALRQGYADLTTGLDAGDQTALGRGRRALLAWREAIPATAKRLRELTETLNEKGPPT